MQRIARNEQAIRCKREISVKNILIFKKQLIDSDINNLEKEEKF